MKMLGWPIDRSKEGKLVRGLVIETTSGSSHEFTRIPSWVKKITLSWVNGSISGASSIGIQIGAAKKTETTGYVGNNSNTAFSTFFIIVNSGDPATDATSVWNGNCTLALTDPATNTWSYSGVFSTSGTYSRPGSGSKSLSGVLDRVLLISTATFDSGKFNILYE